MTGAASSPVSPVPRVPRCRRLAARSPSLVVAASVLLGAAGCERSSAPRPAGEGGRPAIPVLDLEGAEAPVIERVTEARTAVERSPGSADAWGRLGAVLNAHAWYAEAVACYRRAGELDARSPVWPYLQGHVLMLEDPAAAVAPFELALSREPDSALILSFLGDALLRAGRDEEAAQRYEAALKLDPAARRALLGRGELALRDGEVELALAALSRAAELQFYDREVHSKLARVYRRMGEADLAERETLYVKAYPALASVDDAWRRLVSREGASVRASLDRGLALAAAGRYDLAEREFRTALALRPDSIRNHLNLGAALLRQGKQAEGIALIRKAAEIAPEDPEVSSALGAALIEADELDEAEDTIRRAIALDDRHDGAHVNNGRLLERLSRTAEATRAYERALEINPVSVEAHVGLAGMLERRGEMAAAQRHRRDAMVYGRHAPDLTLAYALNESRFGRFTNAVAALEQSLRGSPGDVRLLSALSTILATAPDPSVHDGPRAVQLATRVVQQQGTTSLQALMLLADAQARAGAFAEAVRTGERALVVARGSPRTASAVPAVEARLRLYRSGRAFAQGN